MGGLSLGLLGMDWSYSCPPPIASSGQLEDDDDVAEMDSHVAAVSALLDEDPKEPASTLRYDAPEFIPSIAEPPKEAPVAAPLNGPAITSTWIEHRYRVCWKVSSTKLMSKDKIV